MDNRKNLRKQIQAKKDDILIVYIGNLEIYQGIDLLIDSFAAISPQCPDANW